jgi:DNA polymerase III alpha subunit
MRYNNFHKHTHYSNISTPDCIVKPVDFAKRAKELGHTTLCTTEHGYAGNVYEYYDVAKEYGLKLVFGVEFYYVNDRFEKDRSNTHLMIVAKNNEGKRELTKLISESHKTGFYYKNRIDKELVLSLNPKNVIVTSTCVMSYIGKHDDYEENFICPLHEHFKENFYLEIHDNEHIMQVNYNKKILDIHNKYGIPFIHACDSHYIYPEQDSDRTEFLNGKGIHYDEEEGFILDYPDSKTIFERYEKQGVFTREQVESSLLNTLILDDFEDIHMDKEIKMPSIYPTLTHEQKMKKLKDIINEEWVKDRKEIPKNQHQKYIDAIRFETKIIEDTKMEDYFLLNYEIIKKAKGKGGVLTRTGRGSAPSFYINKLLGFTEIDRLSAPITLYPTRFMSKSRILETKSLPDIDFNTASPEPFSEAAKEVLGDDNVYYMTAYGTMQESEAFRNYCRAKNLRMESYNEVGKDLDKYRNDGKWKDIIKESAKFIDVIDSVSPHPCAFLLLSESISEEVGIIRTMNTTTKKVTYCALIDSTTSDYWKYLKNDFLTVTVWDIISKTFDMIKQPIPNIRELSRLVENDKKVWDLYEKGFTITLNQTGTNSGTPQVMQYKPKNIRELSGWVSAIRPSFASMKEIFLNRKPFSYGIKEFDEILEESDNFVLYQENIMAALVFAGFPEDETYGLLKAIAKKKEGIIEPIQDRFLNGFIEKTGSKENAEMVWKIIEDAVGYGFNSSHAYAVALDSIYGAYLKANYPLAYFTVVLNQYENDTKMTGKISNELPHFGIKIAPIKFGKSRGHYSPNEDDNSIVKGIKSVKFLNNIIADELFFLGLNKYDTFIDLLIDIKEKTSCDARQLNILTRLDFFSDFGKKEELLAIIKEFSDGKNRYSPTHKEATKIKRRLGLYEYEKAVFNGEIELSFFTPIETVLFEKEYCGFISSTFPEINGRVVGVLDIDMKYTPKISCYIFKSGELFEFKVKKDKFFGRKDIEAFETGDMIKILAISEREKNKKVDDKWVKTGEMEYYLEKCARYRLTK